EFRRVLFRSLPAELSQRFARGEPPRLGPELQKIEAPGVPLDTPVQARQTDSQTHARAPFPRLPSARKPVAHRAEPDARRASGPSAARQLKRLAGGTTGSGRSGISRGARTRRSGGAAAGVFTSASQVGCVRPWRFRIAGGRRCPNAASTT